MSSNALIVVLLIALAPVIGGFVYGIERVVKARMQNRVGPPIMQPFYDFYKLMDKRVMIVHSYHAIMGVVHFFASWFALAMLLYGVDLIIVIFLHLFSTVFLMMGAYSVRSVYSHIGASRELIAMLAYEPLFILSAIGLFLVHGSFEASVIMLDSTSAIFTAPLLFIGLIFALIIKLKKSPFDTAEAHQEIIGGAEIEYSGLFFEAVYTAKWLEYVYVYAFVFLFAGANIWLGAALAIAVFIITNAIDNSTSRVNYPEMVKITYKYMIPLALINVALLTL